MVQEEIIRAYQFLSLVIDEIERVDTRVMDTMLSFEGMNLNGKPIDGRDLAEKYRGLADRITDSFRPLEGRLRYAFSELGALPELFLKTAEFHSMLEAKSNGANGPNFLILFGYQYVTFEMLPVFIRWVELCQEGDEVRPQKWGPAVFLELRHRLAVEESRLLRDAGAFQELNIEPEVLSDGWRPEVQVQDIIDSRMLKGIEKRDALFHYWSSNLGQSLEWIRREWNSMATEHKKKYGNTSSLNDPSSVSKAIKRHVERQNS